MSTALEWICQPEIGDVVARGLAQLYRTQPDHPVEYLAAWLLNEEKRRQIMARESRSQEEALPVHLTTIEPATPTDQAAQEQVHTVPDETHEPSLTDNLGAFFDIHDFFSNRFCDFLAEKSCFPHVYVAEVDFPLQAIEEGNFEADAHINSKATKEIRFVAASRTQKSTMVGKTAPSTAGVVGRLVGLHREGLDVPKEWQVPSGEPENPEVPSKWLPNLFISNTVLTPDMHYFRIPDFGSFFAVKFEVDSVYQPDAVDEFRELSWRRGTQQLPPTPKSGTIPEIEEGTPRSIPEPTPHLTGLSGRLQAVLSEYDEYKFGLLEAVADLASQRHAVPSVKRTYLVCFDNMGREEDRPVAPQDLVALEHTLINLKEEWEDQEFVRTVKDGILLKDIINEPSLVKSFEQALRELPSAKLQTGNPDQLEKILQAAEQRWEGVVSFVESNNLREAILGVTKLGLVRHEMVLQNLFSFFNKAKDEYNFPGTNRLHWAHVREHLMTSDLLTSLVGYDWRLPMDGPWAPHNRLNQIRERLSKIDPYAVEGNNFYLYVLLVLLREAVEARLAWICWSTHEFNKAVQLIDKLKAENATLLEKKEEELNEAKEAFETAKEEKIRVLREAAEKLQEEQEAQPPKDPENPEEESEEPEDPLAEAEASTFDLEGWLADWADKHTLHQIPEPPAKIPATDVDEAFVRAQLGTDEAN